VGWGSIYSKSHFGNANEDNTIGWGVVYPIIAGGSSLVISITRFIISSIGLSIDKTEI
jgi:hypothetical protein